jgi:AcrR family transcriptional regulator
MALTDTAESLLDGTVDLTVARDERAVDGAIEPDADELGERLLAAAAEVFAERGYDKAGVAEIARRAGVTTGAIYGRYPGKAELLVEAIDPHAGDELETLFADHHFQGRMEDILLAAGSKLVEPSADGPAAPSLLLESFVAARRHPDVGRVLRQRVMERQSRLTDIVEAAKANGGIDASIDTESLVTFSHALGFGFLLIEALALPVPSTEPWTNLIARLVDALGEGVVNPASTEPPTATTLSNHQGEQAS